MNNQKTAEELLAETRTSQEAYEYGIERLKGIKQSKTMKSDSIRLRQLNQNQWVTSNTEEVGRIFSKL